MKVDLLGAKCLPSAGPINHAVVPPVGFPAASVQVNATPPHSWTSIPRCCLYQARSATGSFALKKIPPTPVTLFMGLGFKVQGLGFRETSGDVCRGRVTYSQSHLMPTIIMCGRH